MVDINQLADKVLAFANNKLDTSYRISVIIVGPPGSGKSTIATQLSNEINRRYKVYLAEFKNKKFTYIDNGMCLSHFVEGIPSVGIEQLQTLEKNSGIFPDEVENENFIPLKHTMKGPNNQLFYEIIGRGGFPNSVTLKEATSEVSDSSVIAQTVQMDGFHLSRKCLDNFKDPIMAHARRGSPPTFDSNNFLQLCRILSVTSSQNSPPNTSEGNVFDKIISSFRKDIPVISIPGFDHALKDPTTNQFDISNATRILIYEGLYLLYDKENWKEVYKTVANTNALLTFMISIKEEEIEERVAKRHLESGIVKTLKDGKERFEKNDLLNARLLAENVVASDNIQIIRND